MHNSDLAGLTTPSTMVQAQSSDGDDQVEAPVGEALELIIDAPSGAATASQQSSLISSSCLLALLLCFALARLEQGIIADLVETLSQIKY